MTVASTLNRKQYAGNGVITSFATSPVLFFDTDELVVYVTNTATGVSTTLTENTHYTVTGGAGSTGTVSTAGGSSPYGAPATGTTLVIVRTLSVLQTADFVQNDGTDADVAEQAIDKIVMMIQQTSARVDRSFVLSDSDVSGASTTLPTPIADQLLAWNGTASGIINVNPATLSSALVSTYMATVLDDASAAAARTTLGVALGSDVQAWDADLDTIAAFSKTTSGKMLATNGSAWVQTDYARPPLNLNPNWLLDQINEGALYTVNTTAVRGPDGWTGNATGAGVFKLRTLADPDNAARKCLEITCTTLDAAIAAGDNYNIVTALEGYDVADLNSGTSGASQITIQFKVKTTTIAGTYGIAVQNSATNRRYIGVFTVAVAGTEQDVSLTLTLDTTGTWLYTNGIGLQVFITLAAGSTFQSTAGAWAAGAEQTTSAQSNFMSSTSNVMYLKRFHVIPGGVALAYSAQDIQRELARAQRHYEKSFPQGTAPAQNAGTTGAFSVVIAAAAAGLGLAGPQYKQTKRATPTTVTTYNPSAANTSLRDPGVGADITVTSINGSGDGGYYMTVDSSASGAGRVALGHYTANARLS